MLDFFQSEKIIFGTSFLRFLAIFRTEILQLFQHITSTENHLKATPEFFVAPILLTPSSLLPRPHHQTLADLLDVFRWWRSLVSISIYFPIKLSLIKSEPLVVVVCTKVRDLPPELFHSVVAHSPTRDTLLSRTDPWLTTTR